MKTVCVVGAGLAGICSAKHSLQNGFDVTVFEQTADIGGTWVFTEQTEKDAFGLDIHSSMYKSLRTNLPKEIMGFPDYAMPNTTSESYVPADDVLQFIVSYCDRFDVRKCIHFRHHVTEISPWANAKWKVCVTNLLTNKHAEHLFDFVMICNGHYFAPRYPDIPGMKTFAGKQIHSHQFRCCEDFKDDDVLVVGAGPSGRDIANELCNIARTVTVSHHAAIKLTLPSSICQRSDIKYIESDTVHFVDGTTAAQFTAIIYCTGYFYTFPFLNPACGITVDDNFVQPLFKHCLNINYPTMALIGLPFRSLIAQMIDLQVRFAMEFYTGRKAFLSKEEMLLITDHDMNAKWEKGWKQSNAHMLAIEFQSKYYSDLALTAGIEMIKPVMLKLLRESNLMMRADVAGFRNRNYKIISDEDFEEIFEKST